MERPVQYSQWNTPRTKHFSRETVALASDTQEAEMANAKQGDPMRNPEEALAEARYDPSQGESVQSFVKANRDFHIAIAEGANNPRLLAMVAAFELVEDASAREVAQAAAPHRARREQVLTEGRPLPAVPVTFLGRVHRVRVPAARRRLRRTGATRRSAQRRPPLLLSGVTRSPVYRRPSSS